MYVQIRELENQVNKWKIVERILLVQHWGSCRYAVHLWIPVQLLLWFQCLTAMMEGSVVATGSRPNIVSVVSITHWVLTHAEFNFCPLSPHKTTVSVNCGNKRQMPLAEDRTLMLQTKVVIAAERAKQQFIFLLREKSRFAWLHRLQLDHNATGACDRNALRHLGHVLLGLFRLFQFRNSTYVLLGAIPIPECYFVHSAPDSRMDGIVFWRQTCASAPVSFDHVRSLITVFGIARDLFYWELIFCVFCYSYSEIGINGIVPKERALIS